MSSIPEATYRLDTFPDKLPVIICSQWLKNNPKIYVEAQWIWTKSNFKRKLEAS